MTEFSSTPKPTLNLRKILTVSELNRLANQVLTQSFPLFWVSGEISNLTRAASGHWYFSLKDTHAQVRCVMFKGRNSYLDWSPIEGDHVEARCNVALYEARGDFQLTIEYLQRAGAGALFETFEKLKNKLQAEGLFSASIKKSLPAFPKKIGIVTSPNAAALHDILITLQRRMPNIPIIIYPTPVQGKGAAQMIANAILQANDRQECDVLIISRGGGSMEDLWSFNEEIVARAITHCSLTTVSGIGHETDFTIADFVADVRAPTPTAAAELVAPLRVNLHQAILQSQQKLEKLMQFFLQQHAQRLDYLARQLISPMQIIMRQKTALGNLSFRLNSTMRQHMKQHQHHVMRLQQNLTHLNPMHVLNRGYALIENQHLQIIQQASQLNLQEKVHIRFANSSANAQILEIKKT